MIEIISVALFSVSLFVFLYFFIQKLIVNFMDKTSEIISDLSASQRTLDETITSISQDHFKNLNSIVDKQIGTLTRQHAEFMSHLSHLEELLISGDIQSYYSSKFPNKIKAEKGKRNEIEEKTEKDIPLDEMPRIPLTDGMKVKFEDEEEVLPIGIQ